MRSALYDELGEDLFENPANVRKQLAEKVNNWGKSDDDDSEGGSSAPAKKSLTDSKKKKLLNAATWRRDLRLLEIATQLRSAIGDDLFENHNVFRDRVDEQLDALNIKLAAADKKAILNAVSWRVEGAPEVIKKVYTPSKGKKNIPKADTLRGRYEHEIDGVTCIVEYEPDTDLRDHEQISFMEAADSGLLGRLPTEDTSRDAIEAFINREVLPYTPDAWFVEGDTKIGYEISFTRHFYKPPKLSTLKEIADKIRKLEEATEDLLPEIIGKAAV
ncbi:MAG: hypothetical protein R3F02_08390 [Thiolinea sp.]